MWELRPPGVMTQGPSLIMAHTWPRGWLGTFNTGSLVCNFQPKSDQEFPLSCHLMFSPDQERFLNSQEGFKVCERYWLMINCIRLHGGNYTRHWNTLCEIYLFSNRELSRYYRQSESQQERKILFLDLNIFDNKIPDDKDACVVERWNDRTPATSIDQTWHEATPTSFQHPKTRGAFQKAFEAY